MNETSEQMCRFICGGCKTEMIGKIPALRIYNFPESSGAVMSHERYSKCPKCGAMYLPIIQAIAANGMMTFGWRQAPKPNTIELSGVNGLTENEEVMNAKRKMAEDERKRYEQQTGKARGSIQ